MLVSGAVLAVIRVRVVIIIVVSGVVVWFTDCMVVGVVASLLTVGGKRGVRVQRGGAANEVRLGGGDAGLAAGHRVGSEVHVFQGFLFGCSKLVISRCGLEVHPFLWLGCLSNA